MYSFRLTRIRETQLTLNLDNCILNQHLQTLLSHPFFHLLGELVMAKIRQILYNFYKESMRMMIKYVVVNVLRH